MLGLEDLRFEVRYQCGRSLLSIADKNAATRIDPTRVFALIDREVAVNRTVWEKRRLTEEPGDGDGRSLLDDLVRDRASRSLAHVFTLLALLLPGEPLHLASRALHTDDPYLRGTALEYLESVLPEHMRNRLWPFLDDRHRPGRTPRPRQETLADLMQSRDSIRTTLEELKARGASLPPGPR
jgi:AAA family ATP:ADP antiporter